MPKTTARWRREIMGEKKPSRQRRLRTTRLQINAVIALIVLAGLSAGFMAILLVNELEAHEHQAVIALLGSCIYAVVHIAKTWADDNDEDANGGER